MKIYVKKQRTNKMVSGTVVAVIGIVLAAAAVAILKKDN